MTEIDTMLNNSRNRHTIMVSKYPDDNVHNTTCDNKIQFRNPFMINSKIDEKSKIRLNNNLNDSLTNARDRNYSAPTFFLQNKLSLLKTYPKNKGDGVFKFHKPKVKPISRSPILSFYPLFEKRSIPNSKKVNAQHNSLRINNDTFLNSTSAQSDTLNYFDIHKILFPKCRDLFFKCTTNNTIIETIMNYSSYIDSYSILICCKKLYNKELLNKLYEKLILSGLSHNSHLSLWREKCAIKNFKGIYEYYCELLTEYHTEICKDVIRTFSLTHKFSEDPNNYNKLKCVLHAFAVKHPEIGYVQGLNFVAGNLLLMFPEDVSLSKLINSLHSGH